jgi:hypothetical protein
MTRDRDIQDNLARARYRQRCGVACKTGSESNDALPLDAAEILSCSSAIEHLKPDGVTLDYFRYFIYWEGVDPKTGPLDTCSGRETWRTQPIPWDCEQHGTPSLPE